MKAETIKEIGKRMGQQKGKTYNYYTGKTENTGRLINKLVSKITKQK